MFLIIEILFIVLLAMILLMIYRNERLSSKHLGSRAALEEYWAGRERRQCVRFKKVLNVSYGIEKKAHLKKNGKTVDISESGVKIMLDEKLPKGTIIDLHLGIPGVKDPLEIEGEIVWAEEAPETSSSDKRFFHAGVRFLAIRPPNTALLREYIKSICDSQACP
ncbi:MAG: PilZ domain-containing protein [Candidatus Omnitrophota bacterium]